jgi:hypothetical protein
MNFWAWLAIVGGGAAIGGIYQGFVDMFGPNPLKGYLEFRKARDYADRLWREKLVEEGFDPKTSAQTYWDIKSAEIIAQSARQTVQVPHIHAV